MASETPRVAALVPTYRAEAFLARTLRALAAQTQAGLEIIVSDDASPDRTAEIAAEFAASDDRFRVIRQPVNLGWIGNCNALLASTNAPLLLFAFQDDVPEPMYVARCVERLDADDEAVMAFSDVLLVHADGTRETKAYAHLDGVGSPVERARIVADQRGSWWVPNRGVFRATAARRIGGLRRHAAGEFSADWPWLLHMSLLGRFARVPEALVTKYYVEQSLSRSWRFGAGPWLAATASAMLAVARENLPRRDALAVHAVLARFAWRQCRRSGLRRVGGAMRAAGLRETR